MGSKLLAQIGYDVECHLTHVNWALFGILDDRNQSFDDARLRFNIVLLIELISGSVADCFHDSNSSFVVCVRSKESVEDMMSLDFVEVLWNQREQVCDYCEAMDLELLKLRWLITRY